MRVAALVLGLVVVPGAFAIPVFEKVNDYDRYGNKCPLKTKTDVDCPLFCVPSLDLCPSTMAPTCPSGQSFCPDGTCQDSCDGIANGCACNDDPTAPASLVACAALTVNITHYNPDNATSQTQQFCATTAQLPITNATVGVWAEGDTNFKNSMWVACPTPPDPTFTFREPMWIAVWALMGFEAVLLVLWHLYKTARERPFHRAMAASYAARPVVGNGAINEKQVSLDEKDPAKKGDYDDDRSVSDVSSLQDSERLVFRGFKNDYFGFFALGSVVVYTLLFFVFLGCLVSDNYGNLAGVELAIFLSTETSSKIFAAVWHIGAAWLACILFNRKRIRNYFRIESYAHKTPYVQVERKEEEIIFLDDGSLLVRKLREVEQYLAKRFNLNIVVQTCKVTYTKGSNLRYFEYQCMRYIFNEQKHRFEPYEFDLGTTHSKLHSYGTGTSSKDAEYRQNLLGPNIIKVHVPNPLWAICQEFSSFLYLYQMLCMWVWYYFKYYQMGLVQTCIILVAALIKVALRLRAEYRVKSMAEYVDNVTVLRDGQWCENISTGDIIPGDIFMVQENTQVPCDAVLLSGTVVVNESSLTGEAMPIRKIAIPNDDNNYDMMGSGKINTLFAGTTVSQVMPASNGDGRVHALALRTGITSEKGMLIHKILFPSPVSFIFNEHIKIAICILLLWGGIAFALTLWLMGRGNINSWFYGVFILSEIFSPLLPAAFTINQSVCAARLRARQILCIDLPRINLSGKVRIFCFDKTGTLTREGLEFYGAVASSESASSSERVEDPLAMHCRLAMGIATCHAVTQVHDQFIGNPVDIESFNAMKWELKAPAEPHYLDTLYPPAGNPNVKPEPVHVLRRFEFVHARASQSVAVLEQATQRVYVFLKGSFEKVKHLSNADSIPADYDQTAARYAQEGCYVLSLAHRDLGVLGKDIELDAIKTMPREELEAGCQFTGFILFRNMLKHDTNDAIAQLKEGDTRTVMITGDTALTGIFIARQCGMIAKHQRVLLGDATNVNDPVNWRDVDSGEEVDVDQILKDDLHEDHEKQVELAVTGRAFEALTAQNKARDYLLHTRVFARMTPVDKVQCVRLHMEKGVTAMCGDGGNDCGALRAAHVGLALSEAEASIVSPFSTNNRSVMQCVELLKNGRAALATSFANFKFLIFYGECMAFWELLMFYFTAIAPQPVWITIDGFITTFMTFAITQARPAARLGPSRPTAKPVGAQTLLSCIGIVFINFWFITMSVVWLFQQDWYVCNEFDSSTINSARWWLLGDNYEAEIISLVIIFQFFNNAALVNFGSVFRQSWWRNYVLVIFWCCFFVSTSYLTLADPNPYSCIFRINCGTAEVLHNDLGYPMPWWNIEAYNSPLGHNVIPWDFRWKLWGFILGNCIATAVWERVFVLGIFRSWGIRRRAQKPEKNRVLFKL